MDKELPKAPSVAESVKAPGRLLRWLAKLNIWFIKASWKKKTAFIGALATIVVIILAAIFLGYLSYKSLTGEDLSLFLKATPDAVTMEHGNSTTVGFSLTARNLAFCSATCSWSFTDEGSKTVLLQGSSVLGTGLKKTVTMDAPLRGRYTTPVQIAVSCSNHVTSLCKSDGANRTAASVTIVTINDPPQESVARATVEAALPALNQESQDTLSQLDAIANLQDPRITLPATAAAQASNIRAQLARLQTALASDNPVAAQDLLALPASPVLAAYQQAVAAEQQLINNYAALNQTLAQELFITLPAHDAATLNEVLGELNQTMLAFNETAFDTVQQKIDALNFDLQPKPEEGIAKANAAIDTLYQEQLLVCASENTTCTPPMHIENYTQAMQTILQTCTALRAITNATTQTTAFITANCTWQQASFAPTPQALLPSHPTVPEQPLNLSATQPKCCSLGVCQVCAVQKHYPVIFVHGHSFVQSTTPEDNLNAFTTMAFALQQDGYLYTGHVFPLQDVSGVPYAEYSELPSDISATATYYYDSYPQSGGVAFVIRKSENIETYSLRLKEAIDVVKQRTGSDKVIIVAHSMGGLVARRYMQVFGEQNVAAFIMIGTPNGGISGRTATLCPLFGGSLECQDMAQNSIFMQKINAHVPTIPTYTIAGSGCDGKAFDGVVDVSSVQLPGATNIVVNGTCPDANHLLHNTMLDPKAYPQVYQDVKEILSNYS